MALFVTAPIENRNRQVKRMAVRASNEGTAPMNVRLEVFHAPQPDDGPSAKVLYVQREVSLNPGTIQTFNNIFADLPVVNARVTTSGPGADEASVTFTAKDETGAVLPGVINPLPRRPQFITSPFPSVPMDNEKRSIKTLVARASNEGASAASVLLEVFYPPEPVEDGPSAKSLYVQRLIDLEPGTIHTFDNIYTDFPFLEARITASGVDVASVAASLAARDEANRVLPGMAQAFPPNPPGVQEVPPQ
ncbi:hypothetical protein [Paenibacillus sp. GP183]|uniref:hypothetical protein n=1 Tax=Paenibacillus sp. GP183 TaxID=1882751 RepID=UPI00089656FD|nr:hypothetical protein [Paenibacillus sp. GP183]SEC25920.1 hypothetical protein SAMN05443246_3501 [Paenibacillus sp. GP183]